MENVPPLEGTLGRKPEQEEPTCGNTIDIGIKPLLTSGFGFRVSGLGLSGFGGSLGSLAP